MGEKTMQRAILVLAVCFILPSAVRADELTIGALLFENLTPDSATGTGINDFSILNFTGDTSGFFTATAATFMDATLTLSNGDVITLGDIAAQANLPAVQYPTTETFTSAEFKATLDVTNFLLPDGSTFTASAAIDTLLLPSSGNDLVPQTDFALINVSNAPSTVPEPPLWLSGAPLFWLWRKARKANPPM